MSLMINPDEANEAAYTAAHAILVFSLPTSPLAFS
jgi:hypothetical protein